MDSLGLSSAQSLQALSVLLSPQESSSEEQPDQSAGANLGPGHIGPQAAETKDGVSTSRKNSKDIWSEEEVSEGPQYEVHQDPRPQPEYEIVLQQTVGTEDLFLGLSRKDPSSLSCEAMLVKVKLPDTRAADVLLDVKDTFLHLCTSKYQLGLYLPQPVHRDRATAQFSSEMQELQVTLPLQRLDFIHSQ